MQELAQDFPPGVEYRIEYDPTQFVRASIKAVVHTLLEAIALVVLVVILFLQTWRASIILLLAVPVSIVGTFALLLMFGYSINALSLFGMVLAIGIVVDDAIVVVENVERNISAGLTPREATYRAMREVSGPIIAIALTLCAVFVPLAFMTGLSGQFYKQFAMTIAISTVISAFNSLTLSPALSALLLKGHHDKPDWLTRGMNRWLGGFFNGFNRVFRARLRVVRDGRQRRDTPQGVGHGRVCPAAGADRGRVVPRARRLRAGAGQAVPDRLHAAAQRRLAGPHRRGDPPHVGHRAGRAGVQSAIAFPGLSINGFTNSSSAGIVFVTLKPFDERKPAALSAMPSPPA